MTQDRALSILKTGANVFLTGEPGSGKTHTINSYVSWLRSQGVEPAITASTGIAATHIHGMTIHAWSGIGIKESLTDADIDQIASKEHVARRIQKTSVLIIDEISMLSANVLAMVDAVCRDIKRVNLQFGGMQVVLVGDFFQLPPISKRGERAAFAFESSVWESLHPVICYLSEQHRQDDKKFLSVLASIRSADSDPGVMSAVLSRETELESLEDDMPRLFTHNVDVDRLNQERLEALPGASKRFVMNGTGAPPMIEALKRGCLSPELLTLKEGAVVMGTKNIPALGIANGTLGTVLRFEPVTNNPVIETYDGRIITIAPVEWAVEEGGKARAKITQVPLRLAWAITIHKSQGMSMDAAAIDLSRAFEYGQGYVALSRVRTLEGVHILGWSEQALIVHPQIVAQDEDFRASSESADEIFATMERAGELEELQKNFITSSGGSWDTAPSENKPKSATKRSTYDETLELLHAGQSIEDIARLRKLTVPTICGHLEKLLERGDIKREMLTTRIPEHLVQELPRIHEAFRTTKATQLAPIFELLNGSVSYDDLRLSRILYEG